MSGEGIGGEVHDTGVGIGWASGAGEYFGPM
jgi:hypothetical protein